MTSKPANDVAKKKQDCPEREVANLKREIQGYKLILAKIQAGERVQLTGEQSMAAAYEKLSMEWDAEVRSGMTGWIQANWDKLCKVQCDCGILVSYEVLRSTHELKCSSCSGQFS